MTDFCRDCRVEQRDQELVVAGQGDARPAGAVQHVKPSTVLLLKIEVGGGHAVKRKAQVARDGDRLQEDLGHDDGTSQIEPDASLEPGDQAAEGAKIGQRGLPQGGAVSRGVMCTMSVPIATWTVAGMPFLRAATNRLASSPGPPLLQDHLTQGGTQPSYPASAARSQAATNRSVVSRAKPNVPAASRGPTSSLVWPAIASSRSWIAADPFMATPVKMPRAIQSFRYGPHPVLITWPPSAASTWRPRRVGHDDCVAELLERLRSQDGRQAVYELLERARRIRRAAEIPEPDLAGPPGKGLITQCVELGGEIRVRHERPHGSRVSGLRSCFLVSLGCAELLRRQRRNGNPTVV